MQHSGLLSDGSVILAGYEEWPFINDPSNQAVVAKFLPDGTADTTYGMSGIRYISASPSDLGCPGMEVDSQDRAVLFVQGGGGSQGLCRLDQFGDYDTTFYSGIMPLPLVVPDTAYTAYYYSLLLQGDDKMLMAGRYGTHSNYVRFIVRSMPDGSMDQTFGTNGFYLNGPLPMAFWESLRIDHQGRIVALGSTTTLGANDQREVLRLLPNGTPDLSFGTNGFAVFTDIPGNTAFEDIDILPDDRIVYHVETKCKLLDISGAEVPGFGYAGVASVTVPSNSRGCIAVEDDGSIIAAFKSTTDHLKWVRYFTDISTSTQDLDAASKPSDWLVFPNPFSDGLVVRNQEGSVERSLRFELMQADGRLVYSEILGSPVSASEMRLDVPAGLVAGSYLLSITSSKGTTVLPVFRSY